MVDIQNQIIADLATRLVIPLGSYESFSNKQMQRLTPVIVFDDEQYFLLTPQMTSMPSHLLNISVGNIELQGEVIINSLDFAITGI